MTKPKPIPTVREILTRTCPPGTPLAEWLAFWGFDQRRTVRK